MNSTKRKLLRSKALEILARVDIASNGQRCTDDWHDEACNLSSPDGMTYSEWIEEAENDLLRFIDEI